MNKMEYAEKTRLGLYISNCIDFNVTKRYSEDLRTIEFHLESTCGTVCTTAEFTVDVKNYGFSITQDSLVYKPLFITLPNNNTLSFNIENSSAVRLAIYDAISHYYFEVYEELSAFLDTQDLTEKE